MPKFRELDQQTCRRARTVATVPGVNSPPGNDRDNAPPRVLGSVVYGRNSEPVVLETEWVELVSAIGRGDQVALRELYDRTSGPVFTVIFRILKDRQSAEEITLDVYHDVWRRASTYDPSPGSVLGWIMNQARSRAIDRHRWDRRKKRVDSIPNAGGEELDESVSVFENHDALVSALSELSIDERRAIEAAYFQELTYAEVADRFGLPLGTIKTRIRAGLAKLRARLARKEHI